MITKKTATAKAKTIKQQQNIEIFRSAPFAENKCYQKMGNRGVFMTV